MRLLLSQAAEVRLGRQRAPRYEVGDHQVPYLRSANVVDGGLDLGDVKTMNFTPAEQAIFGLEPGDVLMTEGSGSAGTVGTSAVWRDELIPPVCFQNTLLRLRPRAGIADGRYLAWWARHAHGSGQIAAVSSGANIQHLGSDGLKRLQIDIHPLEEQRRIADFLDDRVARIDRIIAARQRQLELSSAHRSAELVACVFRPGDEMVPCRTMADVRLGRQRSPEQENGDHMIPYLRSANVRDGEFDLEDVKTMNFTPVEQAVFQLRRGDVLVTEGSASADAVGASAAWAEDLPGTVCFQNTLIRLRSRPNCLPKFLEVWARASHAAGAAKTWSSGASILHLGSEGMGRLLMPRLQEPEQRARVRTARAVLDEHAALRVVLVRSVAAVTEYKQSLITAAVTGELDVTTAGSGLRGVRWR